MNFDSKKEKWEESYNRGENFIFYPKEQVVMFLNRFIRKRSDINSFKDIIDFSRPVRALDYGCGIGRQTILMREFGLDAYGLDISAEAILKARKLSKFMGFKHTDKKYLVIKGDRIPFNNNHFMITISDSVLDSMPFATAKKILAEIDRVTIQYAFISLISGNDNKHSKGFYGEEINKTLHEKGTIQGYFNIEKIQSLIVGTGFKIVWCRLMTETSILDKYKGGRYYIVLRK